MDPVALPHPHRSRLGVLSVVFVLWLGQPAGVAAVEEIKIGGTGAGLGAMRLLADAFTKQNPDVKIIVLPSLGSSGSIRAVIKGGVAIAVTSRELKEDERKSGAMEIEYARSPFVFAVSAKSKVSEITTAQLADIYAGKLGNWPDGSRIRIVMRPAGDGDTDLVKAMSPAVKQALTEAEKRPGLAFALSDQDAVDDLEKTPGALGPTTLAVIVAEKRPLKALKLDGVEPTPKNAAAGSYRYHKRLFLVTGGKPPPAAQHFIAFVQSGAGHKILADSGHWVP